MASVVDRLVIALGLDSEELNKGLENASKAVSDLGKRMEVSGAEIDQMAASASKSTLMLGGVSDEVAELHHGDRNGRAEGLAHHRARHG